MSQQAAFSQKTFNSQLKKYYTFYTGGFIAFVIALTIAEKMGLPRAYIGYTFLAATILLYAGIGAHSGSLSVVVLLPSAHSVTMPMPPPMSSATTSHDSALPASARGTWKVTSPPELPAATSAVIVSVSTRMRLPPW